MKATLAKDLVIGKIYADTSVLSKDSVFLQYAPHPQHQKAFKHVGGPECYIETKGIGICFAEKNFFYLLSPSEIEQYLPKEKP